MKQCTSKLFEQTARLAEPGWCEIEYPQCWTADHLHHDGLKMKLIRGYFLRANWQISGEYPNHRQVIVMEPSSAVVREKAS